MKMRVKGRFDLMETIDYLLVSIPVGMMFGWGPGFLAFGACDLLLKAAERWGRGNPSADDEFIRRIEEIRKAAAERAEQGK